MFLNSGSEAIDAALKLGRRVTGRPGIIAFRRGFHGRTFGAMAVTSSALNYRVGYEPMLPGVHLTTFPDVYRDFGGDEDAAVATALADLRTLTSTVIPPSAVGSILIEPVQGEGGFNPAPAAFLQELRAFCDEHGILFIADEVQCGYGRTGKMWAFEHAGIVPDVVVIAKSIANGLPLSAIVSSREIQERWGRGAHGSTYGGNPSPAPRRSPCSRRSRARGSSERRRAWRAVARRPRAYRRGGRPDRRHPRPRDDDRRRVRQGQGDRANPMPRCPIG